MSSPCPRLFEVEALRDGRLVGVERTRFERHLEACAPCRKEATTLDSLGRALRMATDLPRDELHERRERTRLLESFDRSLLNSAPRNATHKRWTWLYAAGATLVVCLGVVFAIDLARRPPNAAAIQAVQGTSWSRELTAEQELVRLVQGELRIRVDETEQKRTLLVELPDGELEDIGTTFTVSVEAGRTTRVVVEEGLVLLRLRGRSPVTIAAGRTWTPVPNVEPSSQPADPELRPLEPDALPSGFAAPSEGVASAPRQATPLLDPRTANPASSQEAPGIAPTRDPASQAFRDAVATLDAGEPRRAAQEFSRFIARYPGDRRVEDAAYLRVLALYRSGDTAATSAAAQQYLRRHPSGFRRAEVEKLTR